MFQYFGFLSPAFVTSERQLYKRAQHLKRELHELGPTRHLARPLLWKGAGEAPHHCFIGELDELP